MKKIYLSDNYIIVEKDGDIHETYSKGGSVYGESKDSFIIREELKKNTSIGFSEVGDYYEKDGVTPYTELSLRTFLRVNTKK